MFKLKLLSEASIRPALEKVERYRLLNEPWRAESICRDVLAIDPDHQEALISLILAITDQFGREHVSVASARELLPRLRDPYQQAYHAGIICERWALATLRTGAPGNGPVVYQWLREAMEWFEKAEALRQRGDENALLRWNTCARLIERHRLEPAVADDFHPLLE